MGPIIHKLLLTQGYSEATICDSKSINTLARWTPFACATLGLIGVSLHSSYYLLALGMLTIIGALTTRSFYDYFYLVLIRPIANFGDMPRHGNQRRFGCAVGSALYLISGLGFLSHNTLLTYIPAVTIIGLAYIAALTQWCFASTLYNLLFTRQPRCMKRKTGSLV